MLVLIFFAVLGMSSCSRNTAPPATLNIWTGMEGEE